jgi:thymidylate synthase
MIKTDTKVSDVREWFKKLLVHNDFVKDKTGCTMIEVVGASFIADETAIFGEVNEDYVRREIEWYESQSRNVYDIPGSVPKAWIACSDKDGYINSNYGWAIWSSENNNQYRRVKQELTNNPESRRAVMIYTRPSIWDEYNTNGMSDFICTNAVQYFIRNDELLAVVQMRSNDVVFGFKNDKAWQDHVHQKLADDLNCKVGPMIWNAGSLHVYERHFKLVEQSAK